MKPFNDSAVARLPEYRTAVLAIRDLMQAIEDSSVTVPIEDWPTLVERMGRVFLYPDCCPNCDAWDQFPRKGRVEKGWLTGTYRCSECGHVWTCGYATKHYLAWIS